jgi:dipeptidyl aminopeptidase/acylaminoacyl peptidase
MRRIAAVSALALFLAVFGHAAVGAGSTRQSTGALAYSVSHPMPGGGVTSHLCLVDPRTGRTQRLTHERFVADIHPAWSPNGTTLAFVRGFYLDSQGANVFAVDPDGSSLRRISREGSDYRPSWSPDGMRIVVKHGYHGFELIVMNADGTARRRLGPSGDVGNPAWSPDGDRIAFTKIEPGLASGIWLIHPDGQAQRKLLDDADGAAWSPDGGTIAFDRIVRGQQRSKVWTANADGTGERQVTDGSPYDWGPAWSPDGREIAFIRDDDVHVVGRDGGVPRNLTRSRLREAFISWQPRLTQAPAGSPCAILGGAAGDRMSATGGPDYVYGGRGSDWIRLGAGADTALGEQGNDELHGGVGSDALGCGPGADRLYGGGGRDLLYGGPGRDLIVGGPGRDFVRCGSGRDRVLLDRRERTGRDCEERIRSLNR